MQILTAPNNLKNYKKYLQVENATHEYLQNNGYLKIDLPVLSPTLVPESYLEVFETEFRYLGVKEKLYLTPSPELFLKRLLTYGIGNCYYLGKAFRNSEPDSSRHSSEFTMLEFYRLHANYLDIADTVLELLQRISMSFTGKTTISYRGKEVSLDKWEKFTVAEAFEKFADITSDVLFNQKMLKQKAVKKGYIIKNASYEDLFSQIYVQEVEPNLGKNGFPTIIYDYPKEFAALAKLNSDGITAQRFEFYIEGVELGDCYTELTDWQEQSRRFEEEVKKRLRSDKIDHPVDMGFIEALKHGLDNCAGIAIGFERLAMIFADVDSIQELKLIHIVNN